MIETPHIVESAAMLTAAIRLTIPKVQIREVVAPALAEVHAALAQQGIAPAGPWLTYHLQRPSYLFDFEIAVPVAHTVSSTGRVRPSHVPAARVARTVYHGDYEGLAAAWGELKRWMDTQGHVAATSLWECYRVGSEFSADPADWRTELNLPLSASSP